MFGQDLTVGAVTAAAVPSTQPAQPTPEHRVVESTAKSTLERGFTRSMFAKPPSELQQLSSSARQFADVLDTTGNVYVASSVSGFRPGVLDIYV